MNAEARKAAKRLETAVRNTNRWAHAFTGDWSASQAQRNRADDRREAWAFRQAEAAAVLDNEVGADGGGWDDGLGCVFFK